MRLIPGLCLQNLWRSAGIPFEPAKTPIPMPSSPAPTNHQSMQVACEHSSQRSHCKTCRRVDAATKIQDSITELKHRAVDNVMLRNPLTTLEKMLDESCQAEAMCPELNSDWVEHEYTYTESSHATEFVTRLHKLIRLALSFSPRPLHHDPHRAIKLIRKRHDATIAALDALLRQ